MNAIDSLIVSNSEAIRFFGFYLVTIFFSIGIVLLVIALVFRSKRRALPSQKGKTEFAKFYSNPDHLIKNTTDMEVRNVSSVARVNKSRTIKTGRQTSPRANTNAFVRQYPSVSPSVSSSVSVEYYFEFNDQYYLPDDR